VGHNHFVTILAELPANPRGMRSGFHGYPAPRNLAEYLLESFRCRGQFLFQDYLARFIQNAVTAGAISQIQTNG
jgi:hypothetical protein